MWVWTYLPNMPSILMTTNWTILSDPSLGWMTLHLIHEFFPQKKGVWPFIQSFTFCGGQLTPKLQFRLRGLGLWPNNLVRGRGHIQGLPIKEEMKTVLWEEVKYIYGGPNHIRGECPSWNFCPRWLKIFPSL